MWLGLPRFKQFTCSRFDFSFCDHLHRSDCCYYFDLKKLIGKALWNSFSLILDTIITSYSTLYHTQSWSSAIFVSMVVRGLLLSLPCRGKFRNAPYLCWLARLRNSLQRPQVTARNQWRPLAETLCAQTHEED